jgi:hypothetical protein
MKIAIHQPEHFPYMGYFQKIKKADLFIVLDDVQVVDGPWKNKTIKKLQQNFGLNTEYIYSYKKLIDINMQSIRWGMDKLNINTPILFSSMFNIKTSGSQRLADICSVVNATEYISGIGGKSYLNEELFPCPVTYFQPELDNYYSIINNI